MIKLSVQFERFWNEIKSKMGIAHGFASLDAEGRIPFNQLPESAMEYKGKWNASTNTPDLTQSSRKVNGSFYIVSVPGTWDGVEYRENDRIIFDAESNSWEKLPAGAVSSVNGLTGPVLLTAEDIAMSELDETSVFDNLMKMISATGNVQYKTFNTYSEFMSAEDFSSLPNGIYIYVIAQDENYPREAPYYYTTIYSYLAYRDESTAGIDNWDSYEWDTDTVEEQSDFDAQYFNNNNMATGKTAQASTGNASLAVDGNIETRWESAQEDPQWISIDLGQKQIVESIGIYWETASAALFDIQFSNDGNTWTTVQKCSGGSINVKESKKIILQHPSLVRYIRIYGTSRTTPYGYSIYELGVYGKGASGELQLVGKLSTNFAKLGRTFFSDIANQDKAYFPVMSEYGPGYESKFCSNGTFSFNPVSRTLTIAGDSGNVANHNSNSSTYYKRNQSGIETTSISGDGVSKVNNDCLKSIFNVVHPIGEVYVQYPGCSNPNTLYSGFGTWTDITSDYDGAFFRAYKAGTSGSFSESTVTVQSEQLPNVKGAFVAVGSGSASTPFSSANPGSAHYTYNSTSDGGRARTYTMDLSKSNSVYVDDGEVRPNNTAIRIWKRTA